MKGQVTTAAVTLALLLAQSGPNAADNVSRASEVAFVQEGNARSVREIGDKWTSKEGALVRGGTGNS